MSRRLLIILVVVLIFGSIGVQAARACGYSSSGASEILVKFAPRTSLQAIADIHRQNGGEVTEVINGIDVHVVRTPSHQQSAKLAAYLRNPNVLYAEVNQTYSVAGAIGLNDVHVGQQWHLNNTGQTGGVADADIDAFEAWSVPQGSSTIAIAILDSGIDQSHEDLQSKIAKNRNFTNSLTVDDKHGHGTHVAGIAAVTNNAIGVAGTCPNCRLYNVKVLNDTLDSSYTWVANGIIWATDNGAKVINMSFGNENGYSKTVEDAVNYAWNRGVILTGAAHNANTSTPWYPAAYANVIAVGATDKTGIKADFSNYGPSWVDVAAPGKEIYSTFPDHANVYTNGRIKYGITSGTSMATPQVAGLAGLIWSAGLCNTNTCVRNRIETNTDTYGRSTLWRFGRINAYNALTLNAAPSGPMANIDNEADLNIWERYAEPPGSWSIDFAERMTDPTAPSGDNAVFHMSVTNSSPYANVYWFQRKPLTSATSFTYSMNFKWSASGGNAPEALEFPFSVYTGSQRLEAAVQWVTGWDGQGARWRVWGGPNNGYWTETNPQGQPWNFRQELARDVWHSFSLTATILNDQVFYQSFTVDGQTFPVQASYPGFADGTAAQTVLAFQIDNNYWGNRQDVWLDALTLAATQSAGDQP